MDDRLITLSMHRRGRDAAERVRAFCALLSLALCAFLSALYALRPAGWDPITIWPFVFWAWIGVVFGLASLSGAAKRRSAVVILVWVIALLTVNEEPRALLRSVGHGGEEAWQAARAEGRALRVVSLNCAGGVADAAEEALAQGPDIVLLQERPGMNELEDVFRRADGWRATAAADTAVFVRGELEAVPLRPQDRALICVARVRPRSLKPPRKLLVASIHLSLPGTRGDIWRPSTWRSAEQIRRWRVEQIERVASYMQTGVGAPIIFGGDFNTPGGDGLFRPLRGYLRDAFPEAGVGWPDTMVNDTPVSRIDQVWLSEQFRATTLRALPTRNSDHRMVVCEVVVRR